MPKQRVKRSSQSVLVIPVSVKTHRLLKLVCLARGLSVAEIVRGLVDEWLGRQDIGVLTKAMNEYEARLTSEKEAVKEAPPQAR